MQRTDSRSPSSAVNFAGGSSTKSRRRQNIPTVALYFLTLTVGLALPGALAAAEPENVLLDFTAKWCGPCQQMSSIVSRLQRGGYPIRKVDVDQEPELAAKYRVESIPCFILIANGKSVSRIDGITTEEQLIGMMNRLPKPSAVAAVSHNRRDDSARQPNLGNPVPLNWVDGSKPSRMLLPTEPGPKEVDRMMAGAPTGEIFRGQNSEVDPLRASVRIRVKDGASINYGSGTIIESQPGRAVILSCGHVFRKLSDDAIVEIDLYTTLKAKPDTVIGRVLLTDLDADVGLVTINYPQRLSTVRLGASSKSLAPNERLFSIGCSSGDNPSRENLRLIAINKYQGPENLECTNRPLKGRSGGGLFREDELVGVCIAADPDEPRGLYTGLQPITQILEKAGLGHLVPRATKPVTAAPAMAMTNEPKNPNKTELPDTKMLQVASTDDDINRLLVQELSGQSSGDSPSVPGDYAGAEIICIVRSKTPGKPSRVVIVNQASDHFVADLLHESQGAGRGLVEQNAGNRPGGYVAPRDQVETSFAPKPFRRPKAE